MRCIYTHVGPEGADGNRAVSGWSDGARLPAADFPLGHGLLVRRFVPRLQEA